jgi:hypothetical protein
VAVHNVEMDITPGNAITVSVGVAAAPVLRG